ncbi:NUMOD3 MOTIF FAMILY PROTEIN EXPRESSED [Salix viminalis]|uniref:NUMOD3 MOTIF FAMILY PROTEIN EXPRESSED n=2 Tax=Salix viminalis TaxID=40686 RepID=A0A9Q0TNP1_SALVM|nr:NUMOD3 MOTIF FAMILY PROTEIN EXPRESSED [Salix viminalis]
MPLLGAQSHVLCKAFSSPFTFGDDKRLLSLGKCIEFRRKINGFERSKLWIKAIATFEPQSLVCKGDGKRKTSRENEHLGANTDTLTTQVESSREDSMALDDREKLRRKRISKANKGNTPWNKGRKHSPETLQKIRERTRLAMQDPKIKMKLASLGHAQSKETRVKIGHGVRLGWQKRREKLMMQEGCYFEWQNLIAEASRRGYTGEGELQWDSYNILRQQLEFEWVQSVEKRKTTPRPKGSKRAPKSLEQRRKISEAIAAKWADPEYRERVYSGISKYHGTPVGAERNPRRRPSGGSQSARQDSTRRRTNDTEKGVTRSPIQQLRRRSKTPSYKDPLARTKLEMIKNIRAERTATETKKNEAIERARSLIAEAEKAANTLEAAAVRSPIARASLIEARKLIAEAIQSIESVDTGYSISNEIDRHPDPSLAPTKQISEVEKEINSGNRGLGQAALGQVNGTKILETSKDEDLNFSNLAFHDILNGEKELRHLGSSAYALPLLSAASLADHSSSGKQPGQVEPNGSLKSEKINLPNGSRVQFVKEETSSKPDTTKKWVRGRLVEGTGGG